MRTRAYASLAALGVLLAVLALMAVVAAPPQLPWHVSGGGGGSAASANFRIDTTIGQPIIGSAGGANYALGSGFWAGFNDFDTDGVFDVSDNCPSWANQAQSLPVWAVPANDPDCDGFNTTRELHVGTDPTKHCNANTGVNNEPDAWPGDFNDNQITNLPDVISFGPTFNKLEGQRGYDQRYDLNVTDQVLLSDVILMGPFFNKLCG